MSDVYEWYFSACGENWDLVAGKERWDAIRDGLTYYGGEPFKICRASKNEFPFDRMFDVDDMEYRLIDDNPEIWGEDQDSIFRKALTREQKNEIEDMLGAAFKIWCKANNIDLEEPWAFADMQDIEDVDPDNYCWVWTWYRGYKWTW